MTNSKELNIMECFAIALYSIMFLYQIFGVMIHKQYGFGFFYWPVQQAFLLLISLVLIIFSNKIKYVFSQGYLYHLLFISLILFQIIYIIIYDYANYLPFDEKLSIFFDTISWYIISLAMIMTYPYLFKFKNILYLYIIYFSLIFLFFIYLIHIYPTDYIQALIRGAGIPYSKRSLYYGYEVGFHLFFSSYFAIFSFFVLSYIKRNSMFLFVSLLSIYILYLASGRGTLLAYLTVFTIFFLSKKAKIITLLLLAILFVLGNTQEFQNLLMEANPGMYFLFYGIEDDPSGQGRLIQLEQNWEYIKNNFITGGLRSDTLVFGEKGSYIHNILSFLQNYGIIVFLLLIVLLVHGLYVIVSTNSGDKAYFIATVVFSYFFIEILLFKTVGEIRSILPLVITYNYLLFYKYKTTSSGRKATDMLGEK